MQNSTIEVYYGITAPGETVNLATFEYEISAAEIYGRVSKHTENPIWAELSLENDLGYSTEAVRPVRGDNLGQVLSYKARKGRFVII